jgi:hypothetical protein
VSSRATPATADNSDEEFITEWMFARGADECLDPVHWEQVRRGAIIALLRSSVPLSDGVRRNLADELERLYWPTRESKKLEKQWLNHFKADALTVEIATLADKLRQQGVRNPIRRAEEQLAQRFGFASAKALNKWVRRNLRAFGLGRTK